MILSTKFRTFAAIAVILPLAPGCQSAETDPAAGEELAREVEEIDPSLLQALPAGSTSEMLSQGRELYVVCSVCHGLDGRGTQLGPSLRDTTWIHIGGTVPEIVQVTRTGVEPPQEYPIPMPPMGGGDFDETELQAVATYVYALARQAG